MTRRKSELVDLDVIIAHTTERAILVALTEDGERVWLPLSAVEVNERHRDAANITLPASLAIEKGLV